MTSKDRVKFIIPGHRISKNDPKSNNYRQLIEDVFGECLGRCLWQDVTIICRPSQFARFIILRDQRDIDNQIKELKAELFIPKEEKIPTIFDVSNNPNKVRL